MKIETKHINFVKRKFKTLKSKEDLVGLINFVNELLHNDPHYLTEKGFSYYSNPKLCKNRYKSFTIKKKNGGERTIHSPAKSLKYILYLLNFILRSVAIPHEAATGFVQGKSIVDNAKAHLNKRYVYNIDLKDFFHSFDLRWVKYGFMMPPFNLGKDKEKIAFLLASLCTHPFEINGEIKNVLPQGAPTSPIITNILCYKLDRRLNGLAKRFNLVYTRYADDITFSSQTNVFKKVEFLDELKRIIEDQNLEINPLKTRLQENCYKQEVTGLKVNEKVNVPRRYVKQLRMWLYYWEKYGFSKAEEIFRKDYYSDKGHVKNVGKSFSYVLRGKLEYLKMVKGGDDTTYKKLKGRYDKLIIEDSILENILKTWESKGISEAISIYESLNKSMNKYNFIKQLMDNEKFNNSQKERFLKLVSKELEDSDIKLNQDIELIKNKLGLSDKSFKELKEKDSKRIEDEKYVLNILKKFNLGYYKSIDKNVDPRYANLNQKIEALSITFEKAMPEIKSFIEMAKGKNGSLDSEDSIKTINRLYYMVKQIEVMNGVFEPIGLTKNTVIVPPMVISDIIDRMNKKNVSEEPKKRNFPLVNNAPELVRLMNYFTDQSKALKYTTHGWQSVVFSGYEDFMREVRKEWGSIKLNLKKLNNRLHAKIQNFLLNPELGKFKEDNKYRHTWGENDLSFGWSSPILKKYMSEDHNDPFSCPIPEEIQKLDKKCNFLNFNNYVDQFKNEIEIREDASVLENMINQLWEDVLNFDDFIVSQFKTKGISFFTDVAYLRSTLEIIFKIIRKRKKGEKITEVKCCIEPNFDEKFIELKICHIGSICNRMIEDPKILSPSGGDFSSIFENMKNLCDFYIISEFSDENIYRINYLSSNKEDKHVEELMDKNSCEGFTYVLKFYV